MPSLTRSKSIPMIPSKIRLAEGAVRKTSSFVSKARYSRQRLPSEVVERIIFDLFTAVGQCFSAIAAISCTSHRFRTIALRIHFSRIEFLTCAGATRVLRIKGIFRWLRHLTIPSHVFAHATINLGVPMNTLALLSVEIDFTAEITSVKSFDVQTIGEHLPTSLRTLKLVKLPHIDPKMLCSIASHCPRLQNLELCVADRLDMTCCWGCFAESEFCIMHSPIGRYERDLEGLIVTYTCALGPLQSLRKLSLGIFLSPTSLSSTHLDLHTNPRQLCILQNPSEDSSSAPQSPGKGCIRVAACEYRLLDDGLSKQGLFPNADKNIRQEQLGVVAPRECVQCIRDYGTQTRRDELVASVRFAQRLGRLEILRWRSWFSYEGRTSDRCAEELWTTLLIRRSEGRVRVVRAPPTSS